MIVIDAQGLSASRPLRPLFSDVSLTISTGDRIGVVGLNGCGKSTLLRMLAGQWEPESGVVRRGRDARVGYLDQDPELPTGTVRQAVVRDAATAWQAEAMLDRLGMGALLDSPTDQLSGGQRKRVALAAVLMGEWDGLILDEPTNHLDLDAIQFLEEWLKNYSGALVLVTHDRHVLDAVTTKVLEIDGGHGYLHVPSGWHNGSGYAAYLDARGERIARVEVAEQVRRNLARAELAWLRRGAPARSTKPKARVEAAKALIAKAPPAPQRSGDLELSAASTSTTRLGSKGVELHSVGFAWPDGTRVLEPFDHMLEPGDRLGIVGANGAGKSTLLDLIAGRLSPSEGSIDIGRTVKIGYYDQLGREMDTAKRVRDAVAGDKGAPSLEDIDLMRRFWFDGDAQYAEISTLSGGERRRLQLLLTLVEQPNVLLLDEPTNDLDLDTLRALEDFLDDWPGIVVVVSHDRAFLDRTVIEVLAIDEGGRARLVRGGVAGWLETRRQSVMFAPERSKSSPSPVRAETVKALRSPSTIKRLLSQATKALADATAARDRASESLMSAGSDHQALAGASETLATAQMAVDRAEEAWLELAAEAESRGVELE
ncbi:MAG: ABC-F family ATP-binding cassette domain-containing protein [Actinomycetota bacterium]